MLLVAIVVSVGGTVFTLSRLDQTLVTGRASTSGTGTANFSIESALAISFAVNNLDFGSGYVNDSYLNCSMGSNGTFERLACANFTGPSTNLTIQNTGNIFANVSLKLDRNASTFIGGTNPNFTISITKNGTDNSYRICANGSDGFNATYNYTTRPIGKMVDGNETTPTYGARICTGLNWSEPSDAIKVPVFIRIPEDAPGGQHIATLTAYGCDDATC